jgi:hypothetical protein
MRSTHKCVSFLSASEESHTDCARSYENTPRLNPFQEIIFNQPVPKQAQKNFQKNTNIM